MTNLTPSKPISYKSNNLYYYTVHEQLFEINGLPFTPLPDVGYKFDYAKICRQIAKGKVPERDTYRALMQQDLWFLVFFGLGVSCANHPFWITACLEVESGPRTHTLDLWARDHGKSSIITIGESVQDLLKDPNERIVIYSYTRDLARNFFNVVKEHFTNNVFLRACFPDLVWDYPSDSPQWNADGITLKRKGVFKEASVEPWGLTEGYPTGRHFTKRVYDDVTTLDLVRSPEVMSQIRTNFTMSANTGSREANRERVVGTPYHHEDVLAHIQTLKHPVTNQPLYHVRRKPATDDGTIHGKPVWLKQEDLDLKKVDRKAFNSQQLLDPTPREDERLPFECIQHITTKDLPPRIIKLMVVDPAGVAKRKDNREPDSWSIWVVGVEPYITDAGVSKVFLIDGFIGVLKQEDGVRQVVDMYLKHGWIQKLGIEKVGMMTTELHISNALKAKGRFVTEDNGMLHVLYTGGRKKQDRVEGNLGPPLRHGLVYMLDTVPSAVQHRLKEEMQRWPMWKDDGVDGLSYVWDMLKDCRFSMTPRPAGPEKKDLWQRLEDKRRKKEQNLPASWMLG